MAGFGAVLDARCLVPIALADTFLSLAEKELFHPLWSDRILDETLQTLKRIYRTRNPLRLEACVTTTRQAFPEASVHGWEDLEEGIAKHWADPHDAHVVAAAVRGRAELIVTLNLKDFPDGLLAEWGLHAIAPDNFLLDLWDLNQGEVTEALHRQAKRANHPALAVGDVLGRLTQFAPGFCAAVIESDPALTTL
jgi:predicted nucleic acid-binding protein